MGAPVARTPQAATTKGDAVTPLQEAAKAARGKIELPVCIACSAPDILTGRAVRWMAAKGYDPEVMVEAHDGTPEGVAIAVLRLVARCPA